MNILGPWVKPEHAYDVFRDIAGKRSNPSNT